MLGSSEWCLRTPLNELVVRLDPFGARPSEAELYASQGLLFELLVRAEHGEPETTSVLCQVDAALGGYQATGIAEAPLEPHVLSARLSGPLCAATRRGVLRLTRTQTRSEGPIEFLPELELAAHSDFGTEEQLTFIAVKLVDQDGVPVGGELVQIELPDGTVKQGRTDNHGEFLLDDLRHAGQAKISLPDVKEPGQAVAVEQDDFVEIELLDKDGEPVPGVPYSLKDAAGVVHQGVLDEHGSAFISPVAKGDCTVNFVDVDPIDAAAAADAAPPTEPIEAAPNELVIQLIDQDGNPVTGKDFVVVLPDGDERTGTTGEDGLGRIADITVDGNATISFPDFDETDFAFVPALPGKQAG